MLIHVVGEGDTIYNIALRYGAEAEEIVIANELDPSLPLVLGQTIAVPGDLSSYVVGAGETVYSIANRYGVTTEQLLNANPQLGDGTALAPGQRIIIPTSPQKLRSIIVNGYSYPGISDELFAALAPYLTYLSIFGYEVESDAGLIPIPDNELIEKAYAAGVAPLMVVTYPAESHNVLRDEALQDELIENILAVLEEKNYYGVDVDFEFVPPEDKEAFETFMEKLRARLEPLGYLITMAIAPKTSPDQEGLLYEAHDYAILGELADLLTVMTYEWGYTFGPAMAVAPYPNVKRVLDYAVTEMPTEKILMGMPNYGYDWTLPYEQGTAAEKLQIIEAQDRALDVGANIIFSEQSKAPFYNYFDDELNRHEVWFEDARSIAARLKLIDDYDLAGVSYWNISEGLHPQNWLILNSLYDVQKVL